MAQQQPARRKMRPAKTPVVSIPDKLYFRIGDVARLCDLPTYVLRFWETEFPQLKPHKGGSGQRLYRKRDVEIVLEIKHLLYGEGFTIAGARRLLLEKRHALSVLPQQGNIGLRDHPRRLDPAQPASRPKAGKSANIAGPQAKPRGEGPQFSELRKEMRALLTILGSEGNESRPVSPPSRGKKKGRGHSDEPTLF